MIAHGRIVVHSQHLQVSLTQMSQAMERTFEIRSDLSFGGDAVPLIVDVADELQQIVKLFLGKDFVGDAGTIVKSAKALHRLLDEGNSDGVTVSWIERNLIVGQTNDLHVRGHETVLHVFVQVSHGDTRHH